MRGGLPAASAGESGSTFATFQSPLGGGRRAGTRASGQAGQAEHCVVAAALAGAEPQDSATRAYALAVSLEIDTQEHLLGRQHGAQHARQLQFFTQLRFTPTCCAQGSRLGLSLARGWVLPTRTRVQVQAGVGSASASRQLACKCKQAAPAAQIAALHACGGMMVCTTPLQATAAVAMPCKEPPVGPLLAL